MRCRRTLIKTVLIGLLLVFTVQNVCAQSEKKSFYLNLSKTFGYLLGQDSTLARIKKEFPSLSLQAKKAELEFTLAFGTERKNIEKKLRSFSKKQYIEYVAGLKKEIKSMFMSQQMNKETAMQYLHEIELRAKGKIPSPILEMLLTYQYEANPVEELQHGFREKYRTKGHPKSKGLDFQIEYPKSWTLHEGERPNVIQNFRSGNEKGAVSARMMIRDIAVEMAGECSPEEIASLQTKKGSRDFAADFFSDKNLREIANRNLDNVRNIKTKRIVLDGWPGAVIEFVGDMQRLDITMTMYSQMYISIYKNYMIFLCFSIMKFPNDTEDVFQDRLEKYSPLFHFMANSFVIQSQY